MSSSKSVDKEEKHKSEIRQQVKLAPNEVKPNSVGNYRLATHPGLGACMVLTMIAPGIPPVQFVIHRPVGVTDLDEKNDWVMSESSDIDRLLGRSKDPHQAEISSNRAEVRAQLLIDKGLLIKQGDLAYYPTDRTKSRKDHLFEADVAYEKAKKEGKTKPNSRKLDYLSDKVIASEVAIQNYANSDEAKRAVEMKVPQTFRTRGGVIEDKDQESIPGLKGRSMLELVANLPKMIMLSVGKGEMTNVVETVVSEKVTAVKSVADPGDFSRRVDEAVKEKLQHVEDTAVTLTALFNDLKGVAHPVKGMETVYDQKIKDISAALEELMNPSKVPSMEGF